MLLWLQKDRHGLCEAVPAWQKSLCLSYSMQYKFAFHPILLFVEPCFNTGLVLNICFVWLFVFYCYKHTRWHSHSLPAFMAVLPFSLHSPVSQSLLRACRRWSTITRYAITAMWNRMYCDSFLFFFSPIAAVWWQNSAGLTVWNSSLTVRVFI